MSRHVDPPPQLASAVALQKHPSIPTGLSHNRYAHGLRRGGLLPPFSTDRHAMQKPTPKQETTGACKRRLGDEIPCPQRRRATIPEDVVSCDYSVGACHPTKTSNVVGNSRGAHECHGGSKEVGERIRGRENRMSEMDNCRDRTVGGQVHRRKEQTGRVASCNAQEKTPCYQLVAGESHSQAREVKGIDNKIAYLSNAVDGKHQTCTKSSSCESRGPQTLKSHVFSTKSQNLSWNIFTELGTNFFSSRPHFWQTAVRVAYKLSTHLFYNSVDIGYSAHNHQVFVFAAVAARKWMSAMEKKTETLETLVTRLDIPHVFYWLASQQYDETGGKIATNKTSDEEERNRTTSAQDMRRLWYSVGVRTVAYMVYLAIVNAVTVAATTEGFLPCGAHHIIEELTSKTVEYVNLLVEAFTCPGNKFGIEDNEHHGKQSQYHSPVRHLASTAVDSPKNNPIRTVADNTPVSLNAYRQRYPLDGASPLDKLPPSASTPLPLCRQTHPGVLPVSPLPSRRTGSVPFSLMEIAKDRDVVNNYSGTAGSDSVEKICTCGCGFPHAGGRLPDNIEQAVALWDCWCDRSRKRHDRSSTAERYINEDYRFTANFHNRHPHFKGNFASNESNTKNCNKNKSNNNQNIDNINRSDGISDNTDIDYSDLNDDIDTEGCTCGVGLLRAYYKQRRSSQTEALSCPSIAVPSPLNVCSAKDPAANESVDSVLKSNCKYHSISGFENSQDVNSGLLNAWHVMIQTDAGYILSSVLATSEAENVDYLAEEALNSQKQILNLVARDYHASRDVLEYVLLSSPTHLLLGPDVLATKVVASVIYGAGTISNCRLKRLYASQRGSPSCYQRDAKSILDIVARNWTLLPLTTSKLNTLELLRMTEERIHNPILLKRVS